MLINTCIIEKMQCEEHQLHVEVLMLIYIWCVNFIILIYI